MVKTKINETTDLVVQSIESNAIEVKDASINRIFVIDCSWSMSSDLNALRTHLKNNIPSMIRDCDTISIIWFASKGECGVLQEGVKVSNLNDIQQLNTAIDRWLQPVGLTGFKEPLGLVREVAERLNKDGAISTMTFMTDGYDNQWSTPEIIEAMKALADVITATTIVEYGYYCNHNLLDKMAEEVGGSLVFDKNYSSYKETLMNEAQKVVLGGKRVVAKLETSSKLDFVCAITESNDLLSLMIVDGEVTVPTGVKEIFYLTEFNMQDDIEERIASLENRIEVGDKVIGVDIAKDYADKLKLSLIHILSRKMRSNDVIDIIASMGDVNLYTQFINCFSKQDYDEFQTNVFEAINDESKRFLKGRDLDFVPKEDAFTVMQLLEVLSNDKNKFCPFHESFNYNKISASRKKKSKKQSIDELFNSLRDELSTSDDKEATTKAFLSKYEGIVELDEVDFVVEDALKEAGFDFGGLVFNATRPNVSIRIKIDGTAHLPKNDFGVSKLKSFIYRNYSILADGIKNVSVIPCKLTEKTFVLLNAEGLIDCYSSAKPIYNPDETYVIDISKLPILNRKDVSDISAVEFFEKEIDLYHAKSKQKVMKYANALVGNEKRSETWDDVFGKEAVDWLKTVGLTSFNGYAPKTTKPEGSDYYMGKELKTAIKSCSSVPKVEAVVKKLESGKKLTLSESIMNTYVDMFEKFSDGKSEDEIKEWIKTFSSEAIDDTRKLNCDLSKTKMSIIVGQTWFNEFSSIDENNMVVNRAGNDYNCTANLKDVKVNL